MALDKFRASPLPNAPTQYDPQYMRQVIRVLETYFAQLDSNTPNHAQKYTADEFVGALFSGGEFVGGGAGIQFPHNQFYSSVDQTAAALDQAYAVRLENTAFADGISITGVNNTRVTFSEPGIYTMVYSLSFANPTNDRQDVNVWFRYHNGTTTIDVPNSNSQFSIPARKATGFPSYLVAVTPFMGYAEASGVWVEVMWSTTSTSVTMEHLPAVAYSAGVTPAIPATPSAIVTVQFNSATA